MMIRSRSEYAIYAGLLDGDGNQSLRAVALLLRDGLERWGTCKRRDLLKYVRDQYRMIEVVDSIADKMLNRLQSLRECREVLIGSEKYIIPANKVWIRTSLTEGVFLGPGRPPAELVLDTLHTDIIMRIRIETDNDIQLIESAGAKQSTLSDWLRPAGYLLHAIRRKGTPLRGCTFKLSNFWELLQAELMLHGQLVGANAGLRAVNDMIGTYFGRHDRALEGRWTETPFSGQWCAYRRGYNEHHWHPTLINVSDDQQMRVMDLHDVDEWRWALLSRSVHCGNKEHLTNADGLETVTWPLPTQLQALMDIRGRPAGVRKWEVGLDNANLWSYLT